MKRFLIGLLIFTVVWTPLYLTSQLFPFELRRTLSSASIVSLNDMRAGQHRARPSTGVEYPNGSICYQCNNPMNAKWANQANATPKTFEINGRQEIFAAFDTLEDGTECGMTCLTEVINGTDEVYNVAAANLSLANSGDLTLNQFFAIRDDASD